MQVDAILIPAEALIASNTSRPSSPAASSFGATLASSISSSPPPQLEVPIKHQSADGQPVQSQSDQARSEQDQSVMDRVAVPSGVEFELTPDATKLVPSLEGKSTLTTAPDSSVTSGPTLKLSNLNSNSVVKPANKAAAKPAPSSPISPAATAAVPAATDAGASLAHASFSAPELLGLSTPAPNLPDPTPPALATNEQTLAGQFVSNLGSAKVSATKLDLLPASSNILNSNLDSRSAFSLAPSKADSLSNAPTEDRSQSAESPVVVGQADSNPASKTAYSSPNLSAQRSIAASQFPAPEASPTKATPTSSQTKASPVPSLTVATATRSDDSQFDTPIPGAEAGIPVVPADDIPTIASISLQPSSPTRAAILAPLPSPSLPSNPPEQQPVLAAQSQSPALSAAAMINNGGVSSAATSISIAQPPIISAPPPAVSAENFLPLAEPPAQTQISPQSSGSKVNPVPVSFRPAASAAAEPTLTVGAAPRDSLPVQPEASAAKFAAPEISGAPGTRFAIEHGPTNDRSTNSLPASTRPNNDRPVDDRATNDRPTNDRPTNNNPTSAAPAREGNDDATNDATSDANNVASSLNSNLSTAQLTANPNAAAPPTAPPVGANDDAVGAKASVTAQVSSTAASQPAGADKKSIPTIQTNSTPNTASASGSPASSGSSFSSISSGGPPVTNSSQSVPVAIASVRETSVLGTAPAPTASSSSSVPAQQTSSNASPLLPQAHQMLDSAPAGPIVPATPVVPGSAADLQINGQMHVGVRTDAFGAVEIHTVVQQSQVGITVHADRDISRWFSSEVPGLESGLNNSHLNLTGVNFDHARSGVQTATGFSNGQPSNGQPRQNSSQTSGSQSAGLRGVTSPEPAAATETATGDIFPSDQSSGAAGNHFSFHV